MAGKTAEELRTLGPPFLLPEGLVADVLSDLDRETLWRRSSAVNAILRLAMIGGSHTELDAKLNMLADLAYEIVTFDSALIYFWEDEHERTCVRLARGLERAPSEMYERGNILNMWANAFARPLVISAGQNEQADLFLASVDAASALVVPIVANNRVIGSLQLFSHDPEHYTHEDAQLLWTFALVAEHQVTQEYANEGLLRFAFTDYLTGLRTRGYFEQQLEVEIKRAERNNTPLSLLMIDIDWFKQLNDTYGHHIGDQILREMASLLIREMREVDTAARYGGEEFVVVLPETGEDGALLVAQRLWRNVESAKFFAGSDQPIEHLTVSLGLAVFGQDCRFKRDLLKCADAALYEAKSRGRNRVVRFSEV